MGGDTISILDGSTFVVSDRRGDIDAGPDQPHGLFYRDTRFLSRWILMLEDRPLEVLSTDDVDYFSAQFFLYPPTGTIYKNPELSVIRQRTVGELEPRRNRRDRRDDVSVHERPARENQACVLTADVRPDQEQGEGPGRDRPRQRADLVGSPARVSVERIRGDRRVDQHRRQHHGGGEVRRHQEWGERSLHDDAAQDGLQDDQDHGRHRRTEHPRLGPVASPGDHPQERDEDDVEDLEEAPEGEAAEGEEPTAEGEAEEAAPSEE